jgi:ParB-like chromosome segregation protein Spo0J
MASLRELGKGHGQLQAFGIDPREITIKPGFNPRDTTTPEAKKHIAWLKASIAERGVDEPIWVENAGNDKFVLIDGHCRLLALQELWDEGREIYVPTINYKGDEAAVLAKSLISNNGLPLTQLEVGQAADRLLAYGWDIQKIAALVAPHLGYSPKKAVRFTKDAIELNQTPLEVKEAVKKGIDGVKISAATAIQEVRRSREQAPAKLKEAATKAKAAGKKEVKREKKPGPATAKKTVKETALDAAQTLAIAVDAWLEDATATAEKKLIAAHKAFRAIVPAPKPAKG